MKTFLAGLAIAFAAMGLWAQTNASQYVRNAADMRIVDGKMYNRVLSTNWTTLPPAGSTLEVLEVITDGVLVQSREKEKAGEKLLVKHYPGEKKLAKGQALTTPFRALQVAGVKYENETVAAYDCGLANTRENRKTLVNGPIHAAQ